MSSCKDGDILFCLEYIRKRRSGFLNYFTHCCCSIDIKSFRFDQREKKLFNRKDANALIYRDYEYITLSRSFLARKRKFLTDFSVLDVSVFFYLFATTFTYLIFFSPRRTWETFGKFSQANLIFIRTSRIVVTNRNQGKLNFYKIFYFLIVLSD